MRNLLEGCAIAFSMYSRIPVPQFSWNSENMKYAACFFPLIGLVIGTLSFLWSCLAGVLNLNPSLRASVLVFIPVLVSGGIHLDGLLDTADAYASGLDRERKLEIMHDSHSGAFAVICCGLYLLLSFGLFCQLPEKRVVQLIFVYAISRCFSAYAMLRFRPASESGLLYEFSKKAMNDRAGRIVILTAAAAGFVMVAVSGLAGLLSLLLGVLSFFLYRMRAYKVYNGISGDLAGAFLCICELLMTAGLALMP